MNYSIGYRLPDENDSIPLIVADYRRHISEVYFAPPGEISGRSPIPADAAALLHRDLRQITDGGTRLVLLLNASCYGAEATSAALRDRVRKHLRTYDTVSSVTVCSPVVARYIKEYRPKLTVTASVNMRIGSIRAMEQLSPWFDAYYMKREHNRNFAVIRELSAWCRENGKGLNILFNSGCLYDCAFQTLHDNLVSHEQEAVRHPSASTGRASPCRDYLALCRNPAAEFLASTWIRPEDAEHYAPYFSVAKLATRMHAFPRKVVNAYCHGRYCGNLLDLTEPSFSSFLKGTVLDAQRVPEDWFHRTSSCCRDCASCGYCAEVANRISLKL